MSGHSKWSTIKHKKGVKDQKRAQVFTKLIKAVTVAAQEGGSDPVVMNSKLRLAIERAKSFNVPKERLERALKKDENVVLSSFMLDAIGPGGITMIIEGTTDNKNRTISEMRHLLEKYGAKMTQEGAARWAFSRQGVLAVEKSSDAEKNEALELSIIGAGAEDIREQDEQFDVIVPTESLDTVRKNIAEAGISVADAALAWIPQQTTPLSPADKVTLDKLVEELDDHADVQVVWTNEQ